jgi:hypothetical protein
VFLTDDDDTEGSFKPDPQFRLFSVANLEGRLIRVDDGASEPAPPYALIRRALSPG